MANTNNAAAAATVKRHHYIRTLFSSFFGFIAVILLIVSILVVMLGNTLTNTDRFIGVTRPLISNADIQNFVVEKGSTAFLDNKDAPIRDVTDKLLTPEQIAGKSDAELKTAVTPIIKDSLRTVLNSSVLYSSWQSVIETEHANLMRQLNAKANTISLDFTPLVKVTLDQFTTTKLSFINENLDIPADAGLVKVEGKQLANVQKVYDYFKKAMLAIVVAAVLAAALCIIISVHHMKTFRRVALSVGIFSAILAGLLSATSLIKSDDPVASKFAVTLVNAVTHDLRLMLMIIAAVTILGSIGSKVYAVMQTRGSSTPAKKK